MEEQREEGEPMEEARKGSSKTETLVSDSGVCGTDENLNNGVAETGGDGNTASDVEDMVALSPDDVEKTDEVNQMNPVDEIEGLETCNDEVEMDNDGGACDAEHNIQAGKSQQASVDDNKMDVDSNQANVGLNEQGNPVSETKDTNHSESIQLSKGETNEENRATVSQVSSAADEEEITNVNQNEENRVAMDIDHTDVTIGGVLDNAGNESDRSASMLQPQDVPIAEAERNDSNVVKEMEIGERKDNADMASDLTRTIESAGSANPNSLTEDAAAPGNIQDLKTKTGNYVSLKEDKKVATVDCSEALKSVDATVNAESRDKVSFNAEGIENESKEARVSFGAESPAAAATDCSKEASDAMLGSEENQEDKDHECLDKKTVDQQDAMREEDDVTHKAPPSTDPNQKEDTEMEENPISSDYADDGTDSDIKTNGVKRKADVLSEDSPPEGRKTVSLAKVSFTQRPSFKIGACIARAASQMAGSPSVLKGSNFGEETLSVESFVFQLHRAATNPVKVNVVSEIAGGFFQDFRNSLASQHVAPEKVSNKRGRPSNSNVGGTEAFEFDEMGDTYWTDRLIHNGGEEEQTPHTEKGNYQVVPVELKPAQVKRTRRPYKRRQSQISTPIPASDKPANFDENAPAELIMNFSEADTIPPEKSLSKMFRHFGPIKESQTEVDKENNRARLVYRKGTDAEVAYNSARRFNIFGKKAVNYELSYTITETFKVQPYVVSLGEEDAAISLLS